MALENQKRISKIRALLNEEVEVDKKEEEDKEKKAAKEAAEAVEVKADDVEKELEKEESGEEKKEDEEEKPVAAAEEKEEDEDDVKAEEKEEDEDEEKAEEAAACAAKEAHDESEEGHEDKESEEEKAAEAAALSAAAEEEPADDVEKEFDVNDDSDIFLNDEDEQKAEEAKEEDEDKDEVKEEDEEEVKEEEKEEDKEEEKKEVKEEEKEEDEDEEEVKENKLSQPSLDVEEHIKALFNGESLTEDFQKKARTIFEAAVREKVVQYARGLKERYNKKLRAAKSHVEEKLVSKIDGYMDYVVEEWMDQNKLAIEHGLRNEITEEFISDLRNLFEAHNIMIPKGKENLVESLTSKVESLKKDLDAEIKRGVSLKKKLNEHKKVDVLREICEGLADTEIEKLKSLASNLEYDDSYREKLVVIKENYFSVKTKKPETVEKLAEGNKTEESEKKEEVKHTSEMASILNVVSRIRN